MLSILKILFNVYIKNIFSPRLKTTELFHWERRGEWGYRLSSDECAILSPSTEFLPENPQCLSMKHLTFLGDFHPSTQRVWPFLTHEATTRLSNMCCLIIAFTDLSHKLWLSTRRKVIWRQKKGNGLFIKINEFRILQHICINHKYSEM